VRVYRYVIRVDAGSAPNYDPPFVTLAICKPRIRRAARVGDMVLAFSGGNLSPEPHGVRWAGVVSEKMTFEEYWDDPRFQSKKPRVSARPDNIYRWFGGRLVQVRNGIHTVKHVRTDLGGAYVLVFQPAWVFGENTPLLPQQFGLRMAAGSRRGHRVSELDAGKADEFTRWLDSQPGARRRKASSRRANSC
jgi:hypothetical protein